MLKKNEVYRTVIEGYSSDGLGIARIDGRVVFVHRAVRGEECDVLILKVLKNTAYGKVIAVHVPSPHRQEPDCPYYGQCGGCDFRHMDYAEELQAKLQRVRDALKRLGGSDVTVEEIIGAETTERYRNKSQYPVSPDGAVGFYRSRTHQVTDIRQCLIQSPSADAAAEVLREYIRRFGVSCYDEGAGRGLLRHLYVRSNTSGQCLICILANGDHLPHETELTEMLRKGVPGLIGIVLGINTRPGNVILGDRYRTVWGENTITDVLCGLTFRLSVPSFYQVNHDQAERLYGKAVELAGLTGRETVLDLYCGAGTITQVMAKHAREVIGAEIIPEAINDAEENAIRNGILNVRFFCGDAAAVAADFAEKELRPDVICVDPPRKGLAPEVVDAIVAMTPNRIIYVSCDPATLGRDVKRFASYGYQIAHATAVDLFPRTAHVETVVLMTVNRSDLIDGVIR